MRIRHLLYLSSLFIVILSPPAESKVYIDINAPKGRMLPLAIQEVKYTGRIPLSEPLAGDKLRAVLVSDLKFSGLFNIIGKDAYLEDIKRSGITLKETDFRDWRVTGAQVLIKGGIRSKNDKVIVDLILFDVIEEKVLLKKRYIGNASKIRGIAHRFANEVIKGITGEEGIFTTSLLFISDLSGSKEVYVADYDGHNIRQVTRNGSINISPQWSPDGTKIIYTSYKKESPYLYIRDLSKGYDELLLSKPGLNIGGRWSPDGRHIVATLTIDGNPELYIMDVAQKTLKRLTNNYGIDVSPSWSPDGKKLAFVSDIAGNPNIYVINSDGTGQKRLTFVGKYNTNPAWSPKGNFIAYSGLDGRNFNIYVIKPDGTDLKILTKTGSNETPSWSPDGRYIAFSSYRGKGSDKKWGIYIMRADGSGIKRVISMGNSISPSWSGYKNRR